MVEGLKALKKGLEEPDFTVLFHTCHNIAMVRQGTASTAPVSAGCWPLPNSHVGRALLGSPSITPGTKPLRSSPALLHASPGQPRGDAESISPCGEAAGFLWARGSQPGHPCRCCGGAVPRCAVAPCIHSGVWCAALTISVPSTSTKNSP